MACVAGVARRWQQREICSCAAAPNMPAAVCWIFLKAEARKTFEARALEFAARLGVQAGAHRWCAIPPARWGSCSRSFGAFAVLSLAR